MTPTETATALNALADRIRSGDTTITRDTATTLLTGMTKPQLRAVAAELDIHWTASARHADAVRRIVDGSVGVLLNSFAISRIGGTR